MINTLMMSFEKAREHTPFSHSGMSGGSLEVELVMMLNVRRGACYRILQGSLRTVDDTYAGTKKVGTRKQVKQLCWAANLVELAPGLA